MDQENGAIRFLTAAFGATMLALIVAITVAFPSIYGSPTSGCYSEYVTPRRLVDAPEMTLVGDALSGLPNGAAWQGVATDGVHWFMLTSESPSGTKNQIRKYLVSTGELASSNLDAYSDKYRFSSGEIIDGLLYVAVRGDGSSWSHVVAYDPSDLSIVKDLDIAHAGYRFPEGVAKHDGYWWVIFAGCGTFEPVNAKKSAVIRYDADWGNPVAYDLFTNLGSEIGGQDIWWWDDGEIVTTHHDRGALQRWSWTGAGFHLVSEYAMPDEESEQPYGQGFTYLEGKWYFAGRYSDRLTEIAFPP
ncbi:MAG: hypothetical protein IIC91_07515 [Chloroflexi bacterium]|nr:hypothetical protein [Chloroflexota bacterium]